MSTEVRNFGQIGEDGYYNHFPSFLRLFRLEFDALLDDPLFARKLRKYYDTFLPNDRGPRLQKLIQFDQPVYDDSDKEVLFLALRQMSEDNLRFWHWVQKKLRKYVIDDHALSFMLTNQPVHEKKHFDLFFDVRMPLKLDMVVDLLRPKEFNSHMGKMAVPEYDHILANHVLPMLNLKNQNFYYGVAELLRRLFYSNPGRVVEKDHSWYHDFQFACKQTVWNGSLLWDIEPGYSDRLESYIAKLRTENRDIEALDQDDYVTLKYANDARFRPPPNYHVDSNRYDLDDADISAPLQLRCYQKELAQHAVNGENAIICAPTGSGKTIVAIEIMDRHILRRNVDPDGLIVQRSRVAFVVPTVPLVDQQTEVIKQYLSERHCINGFSSSDNREMNERANDILNSHIVVITPQMLTNMLQSVSKRRRLFVSDFSLFVLDECHHCGAKHPYEVLMKLVRQYAEDTSNLKLDREIPQVVGLSASLGADDSVYQEERTTNRVLELCVRMLATRLSTVRSEKNLKELKCHVNPPVDQICRVVRPVQNEYCEQICSMMMQIIAEINPIIEAVRPYCESLKEFKFPRPRESAFTSAVLCLNDSRKTWPGELSEHNLKIARACEHLKIYARVVQMNELLPSIFADKYLTDSFDDLSKGDQISEFFDIINEDKKSKLRTVAVKDRGRDKDILNKLREILAEEYKSNSETRTLIFVETRYLAVALSEYLNKSNELKKLAFSRIDSSHHKLSDYLTSTNSSKKTGGMAPADQRIVLSAFDQGYTKILVVTSVAEEGLDISACNLIIKYNTVGSERTMIQRRGRARAVDSKSVLICLDEAIEQREFANIARELNMKLCLQDLQSKSPEQLMRLIQKKREEMLFEEKRTTDERSRRNRELADNVYNLQCSKCFNTFCHSRQLRVILDGYFCCVEPSIWDNIRIGFEGTPSAEQNVTVCAPFKCINCEEVLGSVIKYADVFLPSIKHTSIVLQEKQSIGNPAPKSTQRITSQRWIDIQEKYFLVEPISMETLVEVHHSFYSSNRGDYDQLVIQAEYAIQRYLEKMHAKMRRRNHYALATFEED